jgi:hypothetical protein
MRITSPSPTWRSLQHGAWILLIVLLALPHPATAQSKNRAPGFETLSKGGTLVIMPTDIELFELSAGGVLEPKAEWTANGAKHFRSALDAKRKRLNMKSVFLSEKDADEIAEINSLHAAVARAISLHHFGASNFNLPTKNKTLDWSLGESVRVIKQKTGADYAFFSWIRDSYASAERVGSMIALALLGVGVSGGVQVGYASLVDLNTGQVLWFNRLTRGSGDLREPEKAQETLDALLQDFPAAK